MGNRMSCFLLLVALADPAGASTVGGALLDSLGTQLKAMRALPVGTRTDAVCPVSRRTSGWPQLRPPVTSVVRRPVKVAANCSDVSRSLGSPPRRPGATE
jgi:hypothetical protein